MFFTVQCCHIYYGLYFLINWLDPCQSHPETYIFHLGLYEE